MISLVVIWAFVALFASLFLIVIGALLRAALAGFSGAVRKHRARGHSRLVSVLLVLAFVLVTPLTLVAGLGTAVMLPYIMIFGALYGIFRAIAANARNRFDFLQRNLATSRAGSVASGLAELVGRARPVETFKGPLSGQPCAACLYTVDKIHVRTDSDGDRHVSYEEVERERKGERFLLEDDTGRLEVTLAGLDWIGFPPTLESESAGYRYREYRLDDAHRVLVIGEVVHEDGRLVMRRGSDPGAVFGMAPFRWVDFSNRWRPLKLRACATLALMGTYVAVVLILPTDVLVDCMTRYLPLAAA